MPDQPEQLDTDHPERRPESEPERPEREVGQPKPAEPQRGGPEFTPPGRTPSQPNQPVRPL